MTNKVTMPDPVAWVRQHPDRALTDQFLEDAVIEPVRKRSGAWTPLITTWQAEAYANAMVKQALEALNNQAQELYESSLKSRLTRDGAADEDELKAIDLWNVESVGMAKAYTNMQKAIRTLIPPTK